MRSTRSTTIPRKLWRRQKRRHRSAYAKRRSASAVFTNLYKLSECGNTRRSISRRRLEFDRGIEYQCRHYPDTIWCWKTTTSTTDTGRTPTGRSASKWSRVQPGDDRWQYDATIAAGYNYPNNSNPPGTQRVAAVQVRQSVHGLRLPVLLRDLAGAVLLGEGRQRLGHDTCSSRWDPTIFKYVRYGTSGLTLIPLRSPRRHHTGGILVNGVSAANRAAGPMHRSSTISPSGCIRRTRTGDEDRRGIAFSAGPELARRLQHIEQLYHQVHEYRRFHDGEQSHLFTKLSGNLNSTTPSIDAMWRVGSTI